MAGLPQGVVDVGHRLAGHPRVGGSGSVDVEGQLEVGVAVDVDRVILGPSAVRCAGTIASHTCCHSCSHATSSRSSWQPCWWRHTSHVCVGDVLAGAWHRICLDFVQDHLQGNSVAVGLADNGYHTLGKLNILLLAELHKSAAALFHLLHIGAALPDDHAGCGVGHDDLDLVLPLLGFPLTHRHVRPRPHLLVQEVGHLGHALSDHLRDGVFHSRDQTNSFSCSRVKIVGLNFFCQIWSTLQSLR